MEIALLIVAIAGVMAGPVCAYFLFQFNLKAMSIYLDHIEEMHTVGGQPIDVVKTNLKIAEQKADLEAQKTKVQLERYSSNGKTGVHAQAAFDVMSD